MVEAYLGLGGNLGDRASTLRAAIGELDAIDGIEVTRLSSLYETPPWGPVPQGPYLNACIAIETSLSPIALLDLCLAIERNHGRERLVRWGPRTLDIDILLYGDQTIEEPGLIVPHPRMLERAFVLVPLNEIAPEHEVAGKAVRDWLQGLDPSPIERRADLAKA